MSNDYGAVFFCGRPQRTAADNCQEPNCTRPHAVTCSADLHGKKQGQACGRRLCASHGTTATCSPHVRLVAKADARPVRIA